MKRLALLVSRCGFALVLCAASVVFGKAQAHGVTLKMQHALAADSAVHTQFAAPWSKRLEEASHGRFRFQLTPAAPADSAALLEQVKQGGIDIAYIAIERTGRFSEFEQFAAPAGAKAVDASRALWEYVRAKDLAQKEFAGLRLLAVGASSEALAVVVMNPAAFKLLPDDLRQIINASSGADTCAELGKALDAAQ
jgi:TRAP-type C4-dicarboxylate transport system substrate-binding protein